MAFASAVPVSLEFVIQVRRGQWLTFEEQRHGLYSFVHVSHAGALVRCQDFLNSRVYATLLGSAARFDVCVFSCFAIQVLYHFLHRMKLTANFAGLNKGTCGFFTGHTDLERQPLCCNNLAKKKSHRITDAKTAAVQDRSGTLLQIFLDAATHVSGFQYGSHDITSTQNVATS